MSQAWSKGSTYRWRKIRPLILARDEHRCTIRLAGTWDTRTTTGVHCLGAATEVHHLHGKAHCPGCKADDPAHLAAACRPCNLKTGDPTSPHLADPPHVPVTDW